MAGKTGPRGVIAARDGDGDPVAVEVYWRRGSTYLRFDGREHQVHRSNLRRENGFALEAMMVFGLRGAVYTPY